MRVKQVRTMTITLVNDEIDLVMSALTEMIEKMSPLRAGSGLPVYLSEEEFVTVSGMLAMMSNY